MSGRILEGRRFSLYDAFEPLPINIALWSVRMNAKETIKYLLDANLKMLKNYLSDLSDADLLVRAVPEANHTAWQLGHLAVGEVFLLGHIPGATVPSLPEEFAERYGTLNARNDDATAFLSKSRYLELIDRARDSTLATLERCSEADLDKPTDGAMASFAPKVGQMFVLIGNHTMMHAGQFTVLRRKLGKPVLF